MSNSPMAAELARRMVQSQPYWQGPAGRSLWEAQRACLGPVVENRRGQHCLEMSMGRSLMSLSQIPHRVRWAPTHELAESDSTLVCPPDCFALPERSMDTVILHHWLEQLPDAHFTLKEAARVTSDHGVLVLFGFNPLCASGLLKRRHQGHSAFPFNGDWQGVNRLRDWLAFVDFEVKRVDYCCFRARMSAACGERWEAWGRRHNLPLGQSYMIQACRRERGAPIERVRFKLPSRAPSSSLGASRHGARLAPPGESSSRMSKERQ
ncbi:methyltransferase domain-containing protein [Halomonas sp. GD1P12]|uniref:methyltransferase domain-containing protein n=1 Tax=Halomonas sp. GD1P12 TaxID=2982691 RepID=UPI0021E48930|nr:methyltransferase domain-containing protein [Halomonas sp. GD1P12]UYF98415.1 methyltransferase type 11 [Halomonas sp. GD1P12]